MHQIPADAGVAQILEVALSYNLTSRAIARSPDGQEILAFELEGKDPAILITAGAHADEPSGPFGALALLQGLRSEHSIFVVPLRDPFAWNGFDYCLGYALGHEIHLEDHAWAEAILRDGHVLLDEANLLISQVGDFCFAFKWPAPDTVGPREIWQQLRELLPSHPEVIEKLLGKRVILPSNLADIEGCGAFGRAYTVLVTPSGIPGNLNRFFGLADSPPEVAGVQALVDELKPGLVLDLHEGQGSDYYVFAGEPYNEDARQLAETMIGAVVADGHAVTDLDRLAPRLSPNIMAHLKSGGPGILRGDLGEGDAGSSLSTYARRYGFGFTTETGRWTSLADRVRQQVVAVQATVTAFEALGGGR